MNFYQDEQDWRWLFKYAIDWDQILPLYFKSFPTEEGFENKEDVLAFLEEVLSQTGSWAGKTLAKRAASLDKKGAGKVEGGKTIPGEELSASYKEAVELGVHGVSLPKEYGGLDLPKSVDLFQFQQIGRACGSTFNQLGFFSSIGEVIHRFGNPWMKKTFIPKLIQGSISGAMALTEPDCGSDLGSIKTTAMIQDNDTYLLNGTKCFISNGGGGIQLVLARVKGDPEGLPGISLFLVEQEISGKTELNYVITKNEEKMGLQGAFTTEVLYENTVGHLVGKQKAGFSYMLNLMNLARLGVGGQALGGIECALFYARNYADERKQFGKPLSELPLMKRNLEDLETERDAMRALLADTVGHFDIYRFLDRKKGEAQESLSLEEEKQLKEAKLWVRKRTPLIKYYTCEAYTTISQKALQVLGGYGFMTEYPLERLHRDSFAPLLYEGTSQIQALMALKDLLKYLMVDPKRFLKNVLCNHPNFTINKKVRDWEMDYKSIHFRFKKKLIKLLINNLKPPINGSIFKPKKWVTEEKVNLLIIHAETFCQASAYIETLRVLVKHSYKDPIRKTLYFNYARLVKPRLELIYKDWELLR
ncbi:acyl-CoA/acyl-ACP dehydrogenase [Bacteriovoracales bacterium]|nr:acyl-CoA/acyl-ACP dehydrogenase [Bacteriovoracales bacterium]